MNADFEGSKKEFWAFIGRKNKGKKRNIAFLRNEAGISVTITKGTKLEVFQIVRRSLEYGNEIWDCNKGQANALESISGDMSLDTLKSCRDKLKWWYKLASMPENRYSKQLCSQEYYKAS